MLAFRLETFEEAKVILIFHMVGTLMELFKTAGWFVDLSRNRTLPYWRVPLFSGFMYASVGSYIARSWWLFDSISLAIRRCGLCSRYPSAFMPISTPTTIRRWPVLAVFIWIAKNLGTLTRTWIYPSQLNGWAMVPLGKLGSWFLPMTISYVTVGRGEQAAGVSDRRVVLTPPPQ